MAFDNLSFRQCSYTYNENQSTADKDNGNVSLETKDIGNGSEECIRIALGPLNTVWNPDVNITSQIEVFFQFLLTNDTTPVDPLTLVPVEYRQGLFRLPRYGDTTQTVIIYKAERTAESPVLYISTTQVGLLQKVTRPDGSLILGYDNTAQTIKFPTPTTSDEYTVKRLTHSKTDFVTYQPSSKLTSNLLNFQKEQEMFLLQEILWTIEMDMVTFTDLSGKGSVITADGDGKIPVDQIDLSIYNLNDTSPSELSESRTVFFKNTTGKIPLWNETSVNNLINLSEISGVTLSGPTTNQVLTYDGTDWVNKSVEAVGGGCGEKLADPLSLCGGRWSSSPHQLSDVLISSDTWSENNAHIMTTGGMVLVPLNTLADVVLTSPVADNLLQYNGTNWVNVTPGSVTGIEGQAGGSTFLFEWKGDTSTDPITLGNGEVQINDSDSSAATLVYMANINSNNASVVGWLDSFDDNNPDFTGADLHRGSLKIFKKGSPDIYVLYKVTGAVSTGNNYRKITVEFIARNGSLSDDDNIWVSFTPAGDKGAAGQDSTEVGPQGPQGPQGIGFNSTGGSVAVDGDDLDFTFTLNDPANPSSPPSDLVITLTGWDTTAVSIGRVHGNTLTDYGQYSYDVCLDDIDGTCGAGTVSVLNGAEDGNSGTDASSTRIFQGVTYNPNTTTVDDDRNHGVHPVTGDTIKIEPIATGTIVLTKEISGQRYFQMQNVINIITCG